ncbi:MAG: PIN domain-containing protein [Myxococcaceae bacterium]
MIFLDTNAVIYLYTGHQNFSERVAKLIDESDCFISPFVKLELQYLYETGRSKKTATAVVDTLHREIGLLVHSHPIEKIIDVAIELSWTRDPFDRMITAHASATKWSLITSDRTILEHYRKAVW